MVKRGQRGVACAMRVAVGVSGAMLVSGQMTAARGGAIVNPGTPSLILSERSANDVGKTPGERIVIIDDNVSPNSAGGTSVVASTTDSTTGKTVTRALSNTPTNTVFPNQFGTNLAYAAGLTSPWTLTVTNGSSSTTLQTPSLVGVSPIPFASNVTISGSSANPTFTWQFPAGSVDGVFINLYALSPYDTVFAKTFTGPASSFTVPTALAGGLTLQQGKPYEIDIYGVKRRDSLGPLNNANSQAWSEAFFKFTPLPDGAPLVNLPLVLNPGTYQYSLTVQGGHEVFIDPTIATGYEYAIGAGDPNFASVQLPTIQIADFDLSYLLNGTWIDATVAPGGTFDFPAGGVADFKVTGIDPSLMLDPNNTTAFVTGLTFTRDGSFTGTQTALTETIVVPEPMSAALLLSGFGMTRQIRRIRIARAADAMPRGSKQSFPRFHQTPDGRRVRLAG